MHLTEAHREIIIDALAQVPSEYQNRFADNVIDALFGQADLTDEDVRKACREVGERMEVRVRA